MQAEEQVKQFLISWTKKEAVIKADGRGLSLPLKSVNIRKNVCFLEGRCWTIIPLNISLSFIAHIAVDDFMADISIKELQF